MSPPVKKWVSQSLVNMVFSHAFLYSWFNILVINKGNFENKWDDERGADKIN